MTFNIEFDGYNIYVEKHLAHNNQDAPVIVFLHDAWGCSAMWGDFPTQLGMLTSCQTVLYDRRGYGLSTANENESRTTDHFFEEAKLLMALADVMHISTMYLYGHSDGATIALLAAALFPERVVGVMAESPHSFIEKSGVEAVRKTYENALSTNLISKLEKYHAVKAVDILNLWHNTWLSDAFCDWNILPTLQKIECPILAFRGENDIFDSVDQLHELKILHPVNTDIAIIPQSAHSPHKEAPQKTLDTCKKWFLEQRHLRK